MKIAIIGGGAAGFFAALKAKESYPECEVLLLEQSAKLLSKVKISGGGRCNVTHACFDPKELTSYYPRGSKELLGPFHTFAPQDTINWFEKRGVRLKKENDGRMFPITNSSSTIIDCLTSEASRLGVNVMIKTKLRSIKPFKEGFELNGDMVVNRLILATGSSNAGHDFARELGHTIEKTVPSLFTFNIPDFALQELSGVATPAKIKLASARLEQEGPLLITHWGFSGPAALKLSAFGARFLAEHNYETPLLIDWLPNLSLEALRDILDRESAIKQVASLKLLPKSLWNALLKRSGISPQLQFAQLSKAHKKKLCNILKSDQYDVRGKTTNKEEFVTCGGVRLSEVNFKTMESKCVKNLFFCGEILDIDGVTGGFNFQNAWTTGFIAGSLAAFIGDKK